MPTVTITCDYDGYAVQRAGSPWAKYPASEEIWVGYEYDKYLGDMLYRGFLRFSLASLPSSILVSQVRLKVYCPTAGGASHLTDIHAYGTAGQEDPEPDDAGTCFNRCASGNLYYDDGTDLRTTGEKWFVLGGSVCSDVQNAKATVNRFSLGLHEEGDNDPYAKLDALEKSGGVPARLEITYEEVAPPAVGYQYSDGLVCVHK